MTQPPKPTGVTRPPSALPDPRESLAERDDLPLVLERLEQVCREAPARIAVRRGADELSYGDLRRRTLAVADALCRDGVERGDVVAVPATKDHALVVAMVGVLRSGGAFFLLDGALPARRQRQLVRESGAKRLLVAGETVACEPWLAEHFQGAITRVAEEETSEGVSDLPAIGGADSAYVFFTSGSSGKPKGVLGTHQGLSHFVAWQRARFDIGPEDRVSQLTSPSFDAVLRDVFLPLTSGASVCVPDADGGRVPAWLDAMGVSVVHTVPTIAATWLEDARSTTKLEHLRWVFFSGEALTAELVRAWRARFGGAIVNLYGPTETTMTKSYYVVPEDVSDGVLPVGEAMPETQLFVLSDERRPCGVGITGEIAIRTPYRARGYVNALSEENGRFLPNPFRTDANDVFYMTGDVGRYRSDGRLEWLGRKDEQLKVRGARVEPAEVEGALASHASVRRAVVTGGDEGALVGYVLPERGASLTREKLRRHLRARVPDYMVPSRWVWMEHLPVLPSGKVDRRALPRATASRQTTTVHERAESAMERTVANIWRALLRVDVGASDDFFELGGHSLLAVRIMSRISTALGVELPVRALFESPTVRALSRAIERELERRVQAPPPELRRFPRAGAIPLSYAQKRLWFLDALESGMSAYNMCTAYRLAGALDADSLERALTEIVRRHEVLRTRFVNRDGEPEQIVEPADGWRLERVSGPVLGPILRKERERRFDLERGGSFRAVLVEVGDDDHVLILNVHHIASDGWSQGIVKRELTALYEAFRRGEPSPLEELPVQYADYTVWQRKWLEGPVMENELDYWRAKLSALTPLELPADRVRPAAPSYRGGSHRVETSRATTRKLRRISVEMGASSYMTLASALMTLLHRYTGREDIAVGSPVATRTVAETETLVGPFLNTLVLRGDVSGRPTFVELLKRVRATCLEALRHQNVPFEKIVETLAPERDLARHPLFQVLLTLHNTRAEDASFETLRESRVGEGSSSARFDVELDLWERDGRLVSVLTWSRDLFDDTTGIRMANHWRRLLDALASDPHQKVEDVDVLTPAERHQLLVEWNDTHDGALLERTIPELILDQVSARPHAPAAADDETTITYGDLGQRAGELARRLHRAGVGAEDVVGVAAERGVELIVAMLAVLDVRGVYLALAPELPEQRQHDLVAASRPRALVSTRDTREQVERLLAKARGRPAHLRIKGEEPAGATATTKARNRDAAYVVFTSGSTGVPKGAVVDHRGLANHVLAMREFLGLTSRDIIAQTAPQSFDISIWQGLATLPVGGSVRILPDSVTHDPEGLADAVGAHGITVLEVVPSMLSAMIDAIDAREGGRESLRSLRWLISTGEALSPELARAWSRRFPGIPIANAYGPAECADDVSCHRVDPSACWARSVAVGRPLPNNTIYVLDRSLSPVPVGVTGEICVGGVGVGRGYLGDPRRSAPAFVPDPFQSQGARLYRTGDAGRIRADGEIEFLGRSDHQIKLRGFRIELGEIEAAVESHEAVKAAVVSSKDERLVAYVVPRRPGGADEPGLRAHLRARLPRYMVPPTFVWLDSLPLGANGKIDRDALADPGGRRPELDEAVERARSVVEDGLRGIWQEVLNLEGLGVHDDFFELGGHSLVATRVISRINRTFGVDLPLRRLFERPTIAGLGRIVERAMADGASAASAPIEPASRQGPIPLSFGQERLWFLDRFDRKSSRDTVLLAHRLAGELDGAALGKSVDALARRHEILRTRFPDRDGRPEQIVEPPSAVDFVVRDVSGGGDVARALDELSKQSFELARGPLFRVVVLRLRPDEHVLAIHLHHIISDGWSEGVLYLELGVLYRAFRGGDGEPSPLARLPIQYADYAVWQRSCYRAPSGLAYWREQLRDLKPLALPADRPRPSRPSGAAGCHRFEIAAEVRHSLERLASESGATLYMTLLAALGVLLQRYSGQDDIVVGSPVAGRNREETEGLIGFFINMLPLRLALDGDPSFRELVGRARERALDAFSHQDVPFEKIVEAIAPERDPSRHPLFQVTFALQNANADGPALPGIEATRYERSARKALFDLEIYAWEEGTTLWCDLVYRRELFDATTAKRMTRALERLLEEAAASPDVPSSRLTALTPPALHQLACEWNDTAAAHPRAPLHELFESRVQREPDAVALVDENGSLSYRELNRRANRLAHHLVALGVGRERLVGICVDAPSDVVVSFLAVLKAGGAYVPLEPEYPAKRLELIVESAKLDWLVTTSALATRFPKKIRTIVELDADWDTRDEASERNPGVAVAPANTAYVIFTSGSTGRPKGVVVTQGAIANHMHWMQSVLPVREDDRLLQKTPFGFDASVWEFWAPLLAGARLVLTGAHAKRDPAYLVRALRRHEITIVQLVPTLLELLLEIGGLAECRALRRVVCGGERLDAAVVERFWDLGLGASLYNVYGPTEATVDASFAECERGQRGRGVPIGRPIDNTELLVLDRHLNRTPIGVPGELYIAGAGLARGYVHQPALTASSFVPNPHASTPGARMYRTGDRARYRADGNVEFLGRADDQVKLRGHRIELGDIESALMRHESVVHAAATVHDFRGDARVVAYCVPRARSRLDASELRALARELLPELMVPSVFVTMAALPRTPSGKVDRLTLPPPPRHDASGSDAYVPPSTPIERALADAWHDILSLEEEHRVSADANFFDLGGHSLLAVRVVSRVSSTFGVELPVRALFEAPSLRELALAVRDAMNEDDGTRAPRPGLVRAGRSGPLPLSYAQQRLWFLTALESNLSAYNMCSAYRLTGALDATALERGLAEIVRRHEVLRTRFAARDGVAEQVVEPAGSWRLEIVVLEDDELIDDLLRAERRRPYELERGELFRAVLARVRPDEHVLIVSAHHIVSDGWSQRIIHRELAALYHAYRRGKESPLAEPPLQYADYAVWQRRRRDDEALARQLSYWREQLRELTPLELPRDRPRPAMQTYRGGKVRFRWTAELTAALAELARSRGATLFMALLAGVSAVLSRTSGQDDVAVGTVVAGRDDTELESLVGMFLNVLTLRADLSGDPSFADLLGRARELTLSAMANQDVPFERIVDALDVPRDLSRSPLFQVMLVLQNLPDVELSLDAVSVSPVRHESESTPYDLVIECVETEDGLEGSLTYNTDLFDATTIRRMVRHLETLVRGAVAEPEWALSRIDMLSAAEKHQLLVEWNDTGAVAPAELDFHDAFARQVEKTPEATAVTSACGSLSYRELSERAHRLARVMGAHGVGPDAVVGVLAYRDARYLSAVLAVLEAGGAFLPLDPDYPSARLAHAIGQSRARCLVYTSETEDVLERALAMLDGERPKTIPFESRIDAGAEPERRRPSRDALAYVIFTSGSTGVAKGAAVTRAGLDNHLRSKVVDLSLTGADVVAQTAPQSFDISVWQCLAVLLVGGRVDVVDDATVRDPKRLAERVAAGGVTVLEAVPSLLGVMLDAVEESPRLRPLLDGARWLLPTGETLPPELARRWLGAYPDVPLLNAYGPAECADDVALHRIETPPGHDVTDIPIGRPIRNTRVYIVDDALDAVPIGSRGEICIGGRPLGRGYLNDPSRTAASFVPNPFVPGERLYRSGDVGRRLADGTIEFLGRVDHQVKIRGYRIELGEVEAALSRHPRVREAVVIAREDERGGKRLVAYVTGEGELPASELRAFVATTLPPYMVPATVVRLDAMPLSRNGKIDRGALTGADALSGEREREDEPPPTPTERDLAAIWAELLNVDAVRRGDDFFGLGGESLIAIRMMARIERRFGVELPLATVFREPSLRGLAALIDKRDKWGEWEDRHASVIVPIGGGAGVGTPLFCVHPAGGHVLCYARLARRLGNDRPFYGIQARAAHRELTAMAADYRDAMRTRQPRGPYLLAGWSMGAVVAHEIACQLVADGEEVRALALFDPPVPQSIDGEDASIDGFARQFGVALTRSESVEAALATIRRHGEKRGTLSPETSLRSMRALFETYRNNVRLIREFRPRHFPGAATLFLPEASPRARRSRATWSALVEDLRVERVPGDHDSMIQGDDARVLASRVDALMKEAENAR